MKKIILLLLALNFVQIIFGAVGCSLNDPDRDVKRIFPNSTGYKTEYISIESRGGKELATKIEVQLHDLLNPKYEALSVDYSYYTILRGKEMIGRIHGVNQKGIFGGMQLILATDLDGKIIDFFIQKISSPHAKKFRNKEFTKQFIGLTIADFDLFHAQKEGKINKLISPSEKYNDDFKSIVRGLNKNLLLLKYFQFEKEISDKNRQ
ncbi:MAG: hypothetical protein HN692_03545 [Candidatus Cloacimonetes bacterium]|nr:hypothetical protein [Candidatus Cloacimonadota bacterium]